MEDDTFKRILQDKQFHLQIKAEEKEIIQNVQEKNRFNGRVLPTGFGKSMCYVPLFGQGTTSYLFSYGYL